MYRKLASAVLVASAINAQYALALGLGGITMHSALNQPLDAEIAISSVEDLDKSQILINFASQDDFLKAGVDRALFLSDIKFDVILDGKGGGVVKLSSTKRLNEPYLDLLLEARWPTGKMLRSYTVLVDLPVYAESGSSSVNTGDNKVASSVSGLTDEGLNDVESGLEYSSSSSRSSAPVSSTQNRPKSPVPQKTSTETGGYTGADYQIKSNETLSGIAAKLKPGSQVTLNQTMLAIKRMNPHAFVRNNINLIKAGAILRVPTESDISQISAKAASKEVAEQNREWRGGAQLDATDSYRAPTGRPAASDEGHLSLTSAGSGLANGKEKSGAISVDAQQKLNAAKENLQISNLENKELSSKVGALNTQVNQLKRMIELKDAELAALQKKLGKDTAKQDISVAASDKPDTIEKDKKLEEKQVLAIPEDTADKVVQEESVLPEVKPKKPISKPEPKKAVEPVEPEKTLLQKIQSNALYFGVFALVLIFGVVAFLFRRKAQAERQSLQDNDISNFDFDEALSEASLDNLGANEITEEFDAVPDVDPVEENYSLDDNETTLMQTSDPMGEADIYIAYGRYDQAAELLLNAIAASPDNLELRRKLLEVYVESKNKAGFQQQYMELRTLGKVAVISHAKELLTSADNVADWLDDLPVDDNPSDTYVESENSGFDNHNEIDDQESNFAFKEDIEPLDESSFKESVSFADSIPDAVTTEQDDDFDLDLSGLDDLPDAPAIVKASDGMSADLEQTDFDADLSLDLSGFDSETSESDLSFDLDESSLDSIESEGDLSFDLSDDLASDKFESVDEMSDEALELGDLDLDFEESSGEIPAGVHQDKAVEEDLSFADFDLDLDASVENAELTNEELEIDFSDVDLGLEDGSGLVSSEPTILRNAIDLELGDELSLGDVSSAESSVEFNKEPEDKPNEILDFDEVLEAEEAVSEVKVSQEIEQPHVSSPIATLDSEDLEFLTDGDEVSTKLDLAQAYVDLGDIDGARDILLEVMKEGKDEQKAEAAALLDSLD